MAEANEATGSPESKGKKGHKYCEDCKISFPDVYACIEHLQSKLHIKGVMKNKYGEKYLEAKAKLTSADNKSKTDEKVVKPTDNKVNPIDKKMMPTDEEKPIDKKMMPTDEEKPIDKKMMPTDKEKPINGKVETLTDSDDSDDADVYPCEVCQKVCTGYISYRLHLQGKKHNKMLQKKKLLEEMEKHSMLPEPNDNPKEESLLDKIMPNNHYSSSDIVCHVCNISCTGPESYKQHSKSKSHMKKLLMKDVANGIDYLGLSPTTKPNDESEFFCEVCEKGFSGPIPYVQHLESVVHKKQSRQVEERVKIKDLINTSGDDSKIQCKECGKMFSGPIPFSAHLKSSVHGKMKKKNDLLENLQTQHPEMFKNIPGEDDSDSEVLLGCEVCHIVFSGPEAARDHFSSMKHKKAVKQRAQFQKYRMKGKQEKMLQTKAMPMQKGEAIPSKNDVDSENENSDEFDIISNPESHMA